jgi:hypothetical protein
MPLNLLTWAQLQSSRQIPALRFGNIEGAQTGIPTDLPDKADLYRNWIDQAGKIHVGMLKQPYFSKPGSSRVAVARLSLASPKRTGGAPRPAQAGEMLRDIFAAWPKEVHAQFMNTSGGFLEAPLPRNWKGIHGWASVETGDFQSLVPVAEARVNRMITPEIRALARGKVDYLTLGIDVMDTQAESPLTRPHAEMVAVYDVKQGKVVHWTGKSYPCDN